MDIISDGASMELGGALAPPNIFDFFLNYIYIFEIFKSFIFLKL